MDKTILVIGSVTAEQYQPLRVALKRHDMIPKIKRLEAAGLREVNSDIEAAENELAYQGIPADIHDDSARDQAKKSILREHDIEPDAIGAVIVSDDVRQTFDTRTTSWISLFDIESLYVISGNPEKWSMHQE